MLPGAAARLPPHLHPTGAGRITARGSRPVRSRPATRTSKMCCLRSIFISVYHRTAESAARPSVTHRAARSAAHSVTARGVDCTGCAASGPSSHPSLIGPRGRQPTMSLHEVSTVQVCCLLPIFLSVSHRAAGSAAYSVTARGGDCVGVLPPARLPFYRSPRRGVGLPTSFYDCWCSASGLLLRVLPGLPSGQADVDITPTRIPTFRADGQ